MPIIRETIVTTVGPDGPHLAPLGMILERDQFVIAPFRPSRTLDNLQAVPFAVANFTDDVRIFAGCLTGKRDWPTIGSQQVPVPRLAAALAHAELAVTIVTEHPQRPRFFCRVVTQAMHAPFQGFSRAKAAVLEAAILVSRLHLLPKEQIESEIAHLAIVVDKTAGPAEIEAWGWLVAKIHGFYANPPERAPASTPP
jgi:hypothetical protein